jgi:NAD(P)-dependent dehydrogenase (short-subunit alcohol dehydrogenase family)
MHSVMQPTAMSSATSSAASSVFRDGLLAGRTAFVAGASRGINLGIAQALAAAGAAVTLVSRDAQRIEAARRAVVAQGGRALGVAADVREPDALESAYAAAVAAFGPIDIVVSGAAGNFLAPAATLSPKGFKTVVDIDLLGTFNVFRLAFPHLRKPGASLIAITAPGAQRPGLFQVHANAAKAGVNMVVQCLAMEWGPAGVRVNAISPGPIAGTEGMARLAATPEREQALKARLPLRRYGDISDIADAALYLAGDSGRFITGAILSCDGGMVLGDASGDALGAPPA